MNFDFLEWPVGKQLARETDTLNKARIKVVSYAIHLRVLSTLILLVFQIFQGDATQMLRVGALLLVSSSFYVILALGYSWKRVIHISMFVFLLIICSNLFVFDQSLTLVTLQYVPIITMSAFYGLGPRWGFLYSGVSLLPFALFFLLGYSIDKEILWGPSHQSNIGVMIMLTHDFMFLLVIHYCFFHAFHDTIRQLDARTTELSRHVDEMEITRRKQEEEYVHQKHLLASISHDIKSPLRFLMITTARLAVSHPDLPTIRAISQSSNRLYNFMKNLLEYTEFRYKNGSVNFAYLDVNELVEQKLSIFASQAETSANRLVNAIGGGVILKSNEQLVGIILHNLIDNANKVTYEGTISVHYQDHRNELHLVVSDTGQGMDHRIMNWINSPDKIPGPDHNPQSFGMGLLIVKELSLLIRARLYAEPYVPHGTSVHIVFSKNSASS